MVCQAPVTKKIACFKKCYSEDKAIDKVGGIGEVLACRLRKKGVETALQLHCATEGMTKYQFRRYLYCEVQANRYQAFMAYKTLHQDVTRCEIRTALDDGCGNIAKCSQ